MSDEAIFQSLIIAAAEAAGWLVYHTQDSRRCQAGFPDLVLAHPAHGLVFAELKANTGKLSAEQIRWGATILSSGATWRVWTPETADLAEQELHLRPGALTGVEQPSSASPIGGATAGHVAAARAQGYGDRAAQRIGDALTKGR